MAKQLKQQHPQNESQMQRPIPNDLEIGMYLHCRHCLEELPKGFSPQEWSRNEIGFTPLGLQVWCRRHRCNVVHIDFEGQRHPANVESGKVDFDPTVF